MLQKIRRHWWMPIALFGVLLIWAISAFWNFAHTVILAGGDNPLIIFEGKWPQWSGAALAVGLASVGSDIIKALGGFILVSALFNKNLRWPMRAVAVTIALILVVPTLAWSVRSATGMAALAFGDTIAGRQNEKVAQQSLATRIQDGQKRLEWLEQQTSDVGRVRRANAREASELRAELKSSRSELRTSKAIGGADPGGQVIADVLGASPHAIYNWTVVLFIAVVEIVGCLGLPALALATAVGKPTSDRVGLLRVDAKRREKDSNSDEDSDPPSKFNGGKRNSDIKSREIPFHVAPKISADLPTASANENDDGDADTTNENWPSRHGREKFKRQRRGRPRHACIEDGHMESYMEECETRGAKPDRFSYKQFCKGMYLKPMASGKMWQGVKRYRRLGRETIARYFDPAKRERAVAVH